MVKLRAKHQFFVDAYLCDNVDERFNATKAAIKAGYSEKAARQVASRLLTNANIKAYIEQKMSEAAEKIGLTQEKVLENIKEIVERCMQREPVLDENGKPTGEYKFNAHGALKGLELIGKHLKMFTEKVEGNINLSHEQRLKRLK